MGLLDSLSSLGGGETNPIDALMELLKKENIELKTDLNIAQIRVLWQCYFFTEILKKNNKDKDPYDIFWKSLEYFMLLMTSLKRERSKEIIKGLSNIKPELLEETNMLKKIQGGQR